MAKNMQDEVAYYYDFHPTEEDLMGEPSVHTDLVHYLAEVLKWLFRGQPRAVYENLNFYQTVNPKECPLVPDVAVINGVNFRHLRSWRVGTTGPAPQVVLEVASQGTWDKDLDEKPMKYALMGVKEYFAYDPNPRPLRRDGRRLFGWQLDKEKQNMREMPMGPTGHLWSLHLESFLVPETQLLCLYDSNGHLRLTRAEAMEQRADALAEKLRSLGIDPDQI